MKLNRQLLIGLVSILAYPALAAVNVSYLDPAGGWRYSLLGDAAAPGSGTAGTFFTALDGTWDRESGTDSWDGSGLGGSFGTGNRPGGISTFTDSGASYLRIQDPGDPRDHTFADPESNRRVYVGHTISGDGLTAGNILDTGITLSFRTRIATSLNAIIDAQYPDTAANSENFATAGGTAWPAAGNGWLNHDGGKGNFGIRQANGGIISFSLGLGSETRSDGTAFGTSGLNMNSLNGGTPSGTVDPFQNEGVINVLPIADPTQFHEFWITIVGDTTGGGSHRVDVYMDGSVVPTTFHVTSGNGNDYGTNNYLGLGAGATPQLGAIDVDFFSYVEGVLAPVAVPEPSSFLLLGLSALGIWLVRRRRS